MSAKHTPGPWHVAATNAGSARTSVWARGGDVRVADCNSAAISLPGRQCDASLIAAAPDLLEAANLLMEAASTHMTYRNAKERAAYEGLRAAIARTTGEQA